MDDRLPDLLDIVDVGVATVGADLRLRNLNPVARRLLRPGTGAVHRQVSDLGLSLPGGNLNAAIRATLRTGETGQHEVQDALGRWHSLTIRPCRTSKGRIETVVLQLMDIDGWKRRGDSFASLNSRLREEVAGHERMEWELQRFKFISDQANDAHDLVDEEGRLLYVNRRACERLGYTEAEMLRMNLSDIDPMCPPEKVKELFRILANGRVAPFESLRRRKDGTTFPVEVSMTRVTFEGQPYIFIVARNITERKRAEQRFRLAVESAHNAMVMTNQHGTILLANAQSERLFGFTRDELLGMPIGDLVPERFRGNHPLDGAGFQAEPWARPMGGGPDLYVLRKDGTEVQVEIGLNPIETDEGVWILSAIVDISGRRRAEEELRKAHDEMESRVQERTAELHQALGALRNEVAERRNAESERERMAARLVRSQEDERRRLSRELHDSTGQNLVALKMNLGTLRKSMPGMPPDAQETVAQSEQLAEECLREVRTLSYLLHPPLLDERGLGSALRMYAEGFAERSGIVTVLEIPEEFSRLPQEIELAGFRVVQECLTNVHRHSGSPTAKIRLHRTDSALTVEVSAEGRGFQATGAGAAADAEQKGLGLRGIRERVRLLGGRLEIDSAVAGSVVRAILPIPMATDEA
jgi:PAS domain S-box-containing protein